MYGIQLMLDIGSRYIWQDICPAVRSTLICKVSWLEIGRDLVYQPTKAEGLTDDLGASKWEIRDVGG